MAFTREDMATYEKLPQTTVAEPAKVDATSASETPTEDTATAPSADLATDPAVLGDGTSDENADPSTATADPSGEIVPDPAKPAKGSAAERIQEINDLMHGYKEFGKAKADENAELRAELAALRKQAPGKPVAAVSESTQTTDEADAPLPDLQDADVNFDTDKLRAKTQKWVKDQAAKAAKAAYAELTGQSQVNKLRADFDARADTFAETHKDFKQKIASPILRDNQLAPAAALAVAKSDLGPEMLYHFANNLDEAVRIAALPVADQLEAIGEIKAQIKAAKATTSEPVTGKAPVAAAKVATTKSITQAPTPPSATRATGRSQERDITDPTMSMDEFAHRERDKRQAARKANRSQRGLE